MKTRKNLIKETNDFDRIYKDRFGHVKSLAIEGKRIESYYYKNPWRYSFSRDYAFGTINRLVEKVLKEQNNLRILEIGCGNGWFSINNNLDNSNDWDCFDISKEAIKVAKYYSSKEKITRNKYYACSIEEFNPSAKYDIIACINTLHHITDLQIFKEKALMSCKPDGTIFVHDVSSDLFDKNNATFVMLIKYFLDRCGDVKFYEKFHRNDLKKVLSNILREWRNETDNIRQSCHDHCHSTNEINTFLNKNFRMIKFIRHGGILMRLLGGLRGDMTKMKELADDLILFEDLLLKENLIQAYTYTFVGKLRRE